MVGKAVFDSTGAITISEIQAGLLALPTEIDNEKSQLTRARTKYEPIVTGQSMSWIPNTHELKIKNRLGQTEEERGIMSRLEKLFDGQISTWSYKAKRVMVACSLFGYGCSDEALIMIMAGTTKALFYELGINITDQQIAKAFPSRATISDMETEVAVDCVLRTCQEMKEDGVQKIGLMTDHGHRKGQDHFVKIISWAGKNENDDWTIKFHCVDVDSSGHSAKEAAHAVKVSTEELLSILNEITDETETKITFITGDAGGGAAVQHIHKELIRIGVMDSNSKKVACDMHNFVKPLEVACVDTWGRQGIGHRTPFQMVWLFVTLLKKVRKEYATSLERA